MKVITTTYGSLTANNSISIQSVVYNTIYGNGNDIAALTLIEEIPYYLADIYEKLGMQAQVLTFDDIFDDTFN